MDIWLDIEINLCEDLFEITREYADELERKKAVFQQKTATKKTVFLTLVTPYGVKENNHSQGLVDQQVTMDALF